MIHLFFVMLTIVSAVAATGLIAIKIVFVLFDYDAHLDDLFQVYVAVFYIGFLGLLITHES